MSWLKWVALSVSAMVLSACVEIKSDAKIASDAKVSFTTTYDVSKIIAAMQMTNKNSSEDVAKSLSCEKMNEQLTKEYSCKDLGLGKFAVSGTFAGDASNGVTLDEDKNQLSIDAVQLFKKVADLNPSQQKNAAEDAASALMQKSLVPVAADQAAQYKQIGMALALNVTLPSEVLTVDGADAKDVKENTVAINFVEVAGKDSYVITSKIKKSQIWWKVLFVLAAIAALASAVLYLLKRKKKDSAKPVEPTESMKTTESIDVGNKD
ncbi:MAG: hypothetical protein ACRCV6_02505 [Formosimonas sp.]